MTSESDLTFLSAFQEEKRMPSNHCDNYIKQCRWADEHLVATAHSISKTIIIPVGCASGFGGADYCLRMWVLNMHELTYSVTSYWMPTLYLVLMGHSGAQDKTLLYGRWKGEAVNGIRDEQDAREVPKRHTLSGHGHQRRFLKKGFTESSTMSLIKTMMLRKKEKVDM